MKFLLAVVVMFFLNLVNANQMVDLFDIRIGGRLSLVPSLLINVRTNNFICDLVQYSWYGSHREPSIITTDLHQSLCVAPNSNFAVTNRRTVPGFSLEWNDMSQNIYIGRTNPKQAMAFNLQLKELVSAAMQPQFFIEIDRLKVREVKLRIRDNSQGTVEQDLRYSERISITAHGTLIINSVISANGSVETIPSETILGILSSI